MEAEGWRGYVVGLSAVVAADGLWLESLKWPVGVQLVIS